MIWRFIDTDRIDGYFSAALFESIGRHVGSGRIEETILFWRVRRPVVYIGYHQCVEEEIRERYCTASGVQIIRRVLGGGCGFCDENQILFSIIGREGGSVISSDIHETYSSVLGGVVAALRTLGFDGRYEPRWGAVHVKGRKISGSAQGRFDGAVLVNGSLLLDFNFDDMDRVLKNPTKNLREGISSARDGMITLSELLGRTPDLEEAKSVLRDGFEAALGVTTRDGVLTESEIELAEHLSKRHKSRDWIYRMDNKRRKQIVRKSNAES
ncbi:Lipoate-protein ligase A subunit 1 [Candidatus Methanoperedenaceae archaeon GB37]|nr:Lipoate-protein ligase A subunit 1 [Candidatus Methanoperedenaceae archaeon GB37]